MKYFDGRVFAPVIRPGFEVVREERILNKIKHFQTQIATVILSVSLVAGFFVQQSTQINVY